MDWLLLATIVTLVVLGVSVHQVWKQFREDFPPRKKRHGAPSE